MKVISTISNNNDWYLITADFEEYIKIQERVIAFFIIVDRQGVAEPWRVDSQVNFQRSQNRKVQQRQNNKGVRWGDMET